MSNFNFKQVAKEATSLCWLIPGREKLSTDDVVNKPLTIVSFGFAQKFDQAGVPVVDDNGMAEQFGVVVFKELPDKYYCVGSVGTRVCRMWADGFDGDEREASAALEQEGGVPVKFVRSMTRRGNNLVTMEIL